MLKQESPRATSLLRHGYRRGWLPTFPAITAEDLRQCAAAPAELPRRHCNPAAQHWMTWRYPQVVALVVELRRGAAITHIHVAAGEGLTSILHSVLLIPPCSVHNVNPQVQRPWGALKARQRAALRRTGSDGTETQTFRRPGLSILPYFTDSQLTFASAIGRGGEVPL